MLKIVDQCFLPLALESILFYICYICCCSSIWSCSFHSFWNAIWAYAWSESNSTTLGEIYYSLYFVGFFKYYSFVRKFWADGLLELRCFIKWWLLALWLGRGLSSRNALFVLLWLCKCLLFIFISPLSASTLSKLSSRPRSVFNSLISKFCF